MFSPGTLLRGLLAALAFSAMVQWCNAAANPWLHEAGPDGTIRFELRELTGHPHFWWPRTLLNYRVTPGGGPVEAWSLADAATGAGVPFQVSDIARESGRITRATVSFFSDLPTGAGRAFLLKTTGAAVARPEVLPKIAVNEEQGTMVLDTGAVKVRMPASQGKVDGVAPGPITGMEAGYGWVGESAIRGRPVRSITTALMDNGPLFARVRVTYQLAGDASYTVTIKAARGQNFVEMEEEFAGLKAEDAVTWDMDWKGLNLTHRRGREAIDEPHILYSRGEDPHFTGPGHVEDPAQCFYYRLGHSAADSTLSVTAADFTDAATGRAVGLAVLDGARWDDGGYSIWASSDTQAVRFRYAEKRLQWTLPLAGRSRSLAVTAYDWRTAGADMGEPMRRWLGTDSPMARANTGMQPDKSWPSFINSRYGGLGLDVVKDWQLDYPDTARRQTDAPPPVSPPAGRGPMSGMDAYLKAFWEPNEMLRIEGGWLSPVSLRIMSAWVTPGFARYRGQMTPEMRRRVTAVLLMQAYAASREEISPMIHMLKGHPNFMADWKYPLMAGAWLFPEHPLAAEWADQWEKCVELMGIFYVRPAVKAWGALGGRWTESIATYNWAALEPLARANALGVLYDGRVRIAGAGIAAHAAYLTGIASAPVKLGTGGAPFDFQPGGVLTPENGFQRIHPQQGAHSGRRAIPRVIEDIGHALADYAPAIGENLLWLDRRPGLPGSAGTNPRLRSAKYTGYGFVLRAAVDTPDEIAVYLQQIDKGPNYRWGFGNEGGCGDIYYYAGGASYAGHMMEDAGDRAATDAELTANTGVYKDQTFRGIGMNDLTGPLLNLESAQFAEIYARRGPDAYSWPEYVSRSVLLVGHDYIVTFDAVNKMSRVSWSTIEGGDKMPNIIPLRGETAYRGTERFEGGRAGSVVIARLDPYKGGGDRMVLVSHRADLRAHNVRDTGAVEVGGSAGKDYVYQMREPFVSDDGQRHFAGRVGVIREFKDGRTELNLLSGESIASRGMWIGSDNASLGVSASFKNPGEARGCYSSTGGGVVTFALKGADADALYIDGARAGAVADGGKLTARFPAGEGRWQLTSGAAEPMEPEINQVVSRADGATLVYGVAPAATRYRIERSDDGGATWRAIGDTTATQYVISGITPPARFHVRLVALNGSVESRPGRDAPVIVTGKPVAAPAGLRLRLYRDHVWATWGEVPGARFYALYARKQGEPAWQRLYSGIEPSAYAGGAGIVPNSAMPGLAAEAARDPAPAPPIYEYCVSAMDDSGEGEKSPIATTDPSSWRNWYPPVPLTYTRRTAYWLPPYMAPGQAPPERYPQ